ncbi:MAG: thrombospondin type 3 repeat-containing protein [Verrucomicrobiota bacterium]|jgi:hypothetical protein
MKTYLLSLAIVTLTFLSFNVSAATHYVDLNSTNPVSPYTNWSTAAMKIQDAVGAAAADDQIMVTNGTYSPVTVTQPVALQSVNGPAFTFINGGGVARCVNLASGASLSGFTLANGSASGSSGGGVNCASVSVTVSNCVLKSNSADSGGGAYSGTLVNCILNGNTAAFYGGGACSILNNCVLSNNSCGNVGGGAFGATLNNCTLVSNSVAVLYGLGGGTYSSTLNGCKLVGNFANGRGGGAYFGTLNNCLVIGNTVTYDGGGAAFATLNNCTVISNSANACGGAYLCTLRNCIVYYNNAQSGVANAVGCAYCCTTPTEWPNIRNFTNAPLFVDLAGGNLHLQSNSPCINSGKNTYATNSTDFDGNPRIVGGTVDVGAYEYQTPASAISYAWLQQYGFTNNGSADYVDTDGDGMNNWQEWLTGTDPTNAADVLKMLTPVFTNNSKGITVSWQSVTNWAYYLQRSTNLLGQPPFITIQTGIPADFGITTYTDATATNSGPYFYRVGVQ